MEKLLNGWEVIKMLSENCLSIGDKFLCIDESDNDVYIVKAISSFWGLSLAWSGHDLEPGQIAMCKFLKIS